MSGVRRAWRELGRLAVAAGLACLGLGCFLATLLTAGLSLLGVGLPLLDRTLAGTRELLDRQRHRLPGPPVRSPYRPVAGPLVARLRTAAGDPATYRDLAFLFAHFCFAPVALALAVGLWLGAAQGLALPLIHTVAPGAVDNYLGVPIDSPGNAALAMVPALLVGVGAYWLPRGLLHLDDRLTRALLAPTARAALVERVEELTDTRAQTVDAQAAELRRIERDLHDGAQARLVAMAMNLGLAEELLARDPEAARGLVAEARTSAGTALSELRDVVRGIHPPVLADRGLAGGVAALALGAALPVDLDVDLPDRLAPPLESALYFTVAELLTNAARHSGAARVAVRLRRLDDTVALTVSDDGRGGADPERGTGLAGIRRRLAAFDGRVRISSPAGGPTVVDVELPCES
ncbi:Signal transduction histidine kinase [Micromonospora citrea]|uniref:histidine kinase n=1 Tax=Micromonospora citrea TaxID=47855 RepID=A0A1C6UN22_9ACTN|nr:sensor histidine kinase [Micromonospora citrea]SCL55451.1 Signal transduction histidine kinase [Micromonospora citrea]